MTYVLLVHVRGPVPMYQFGCDSDLVLVTKKLVSDFQVCGTLRSHTVTGIKQVVNRSISSENLWLWGTFSNIYPGVKELIKT